MSSSGGKAFQVEGTARTKALRHEQLGMCVAQQESQGSWSRDREGASGGEGLEGEEGPDP